MAQNRHSRAHWLTAPPSHWHRPIVACCLVCYAPLLRFTNTTNKQLSGIAGYIWPEEGLALVFGSKLPGNQSGTKSYAKTYTNLPD
jgi:hypothetical protein